MLKRARPAPIGGDNGVNQVSIASTPVMSTADEFGEVRLVFQQLVVRAHQLHAGAAILEIAEIAGAADSLKRAATQASDTHATNSDPSVWDALAALVNQIGAESR